MTVPPIDDDELEEPSPTRQRRRSDRLSFFAIWDKIVLLAAVGLATWAVFSVQGKADKAEVAADKTSAAVEQQKQGRRVALDILCGGLFGVENAGRLTILDKLPRPAPQRGHQTSAEMRSRLRYAQAYAQVISEAVIVQAGVDVKNVLRRDGTIDCDRLKAAARAVGG